MTDPVLQTIGIRKSFGALQASKDISIDLHPGEIHALIGPNGAGKSTLIQQIAGGLRPDAGQVRLNGEDVTALRTAARAKRGLARTFQISALAMEDTVLQNAVLGATGASGTPFRFFGRALAQRQMREIAEHALEQVGLTDHAKTRTSDLSHGQRRQLEVAVALTLSPKAFVMDEPMAGLGFEGSKALTGFLDGLRTTAPILLVEHDMDAVFALADRISVLVYGEVIATGTADEIRTDPAVRSAYLGEEA
ncbi:ABC transporter ATP-binding protein [Rhodophyticola sp. CCM32]|uniref:ABC transporter ATP-binding protein n=1 Tax=Rhodophyticola sp. CCM32 TaxID=2916397 RepID=UPI00107F60BE|nr:ABC transporter ATP-binding protein [Rhodophyticola sp. CCM32]QBY01282.1 ABC transporter ATP-binding protein [Rhodophyticola sp. CCM32]